MLKTKIGLTKKIKRIFLFPQVDIIQNDSVQDGNAFVGSGSQDPIVPWNNKEGMKTPGESQPTRSCPGVVCSAPPSTQPSNAFNCVESWTTNINPIIPSMGSKSDCWYKRQLQSYWVEFNK